MRPADQPLNHRKEEGLWGPISENICYMMSVVGYENLFLGEIWNPVLKWLVVEDFFTMKVAASTPPNMRKHTYS